MAVLDVQSMIYYGWSCAASYCFITFHTAEYPMSGGSMWSVKVCRARSDQDSVRAAGVASSLIRKTGVKEAGRCCMIRDLLSDVQVMLGQTVCAAYLHMHKV
eukprot:502263-Pelagomonas_calceolata.AAC.1